jgi:hypothetical protein
LGVSKGTAQRAFLSLPPLRCDAFRRNSLKSITDRLLEPGTGSLTERLENLRAIAMEHLANLRKLVYHPQSVEQTRAVLAEHFGSFKLEPVNEQGKLIYRAHARVDFFGDRAVARTGGAGGPVCTILPQAKCFVDLAA